MRSVEAEEADPTSTLQLYRAVLAARRSSPALRTGDLVRRSSPDGALIFERCLGRDQRTVIVNFTEADVEVALPTEHVLVVATDRTPGGTTYAGLVAAESAVVLKPASDDDH